MTARNHCCLLFFFREVNCERTKEKSLEVKRKSSQPISESILQGMSVFSLKAAFFQSITHLFIFR